MTMTTTKLPEFKGKPLVEIPKIILTADFLEGSFGRSVLEEYQGRARADYDNSASLNVLSYQNGVVVGCNPFAVVLLNQIVSQERPRRANHLPDLERVIKADRPDLQLKSHYEDSDLALRSEEEPNIYLAVDLARQIRSRDPKFRLPAKSPLSSLELRKDPNSPYGLAFKLREDAQVIHAPQLDHKNNGKRFNETDENCLPIFDENGKRTLYTRESGLSRLFLSRDLVLSSCDDDLASSSAGGRVVVSSGEATAQNLDSYFAKLTKELEKEKADLEERFKKAKAILKGN